jgi:flavin reductase (DIM6/NTAB) family NADH-FMN oxidoreductase RutF
MTKAMTSSFVEERPVAAAVDPAELRNAMSSFITGVTVVTTRTESGGIAGMTANSFTSVSLDPPLVLVCLSNNSRSYQAILSSRQIAIHILADDQSGLARAFASKGGDRSSICKWQVSPRGNAILERCLAVFECSVFDIQHAGDHAIVIARVEVISKPASNTGPLVYHKGRMFALGTAAVWEC